MNSFEEFFKIINQIDQDLINENVIPQISIIAEEFKDLNIKMFKELNEKKLSLVFLLTKFKKFRLAERIFEVLDLNETYLYFLYYSMISDSNYLKEISNNVKFSKELEFKSSHLSFFKNLEKLFLIEYNYLHNLFLISPQIIINHQKIIETKDDQTIKNFIKSLRKETTHNIFSSENFQETKETARFIVNSEYEIIERILNDVLYNKETQAICNSAILSEVFFHDLTNFINKFCSFVFLPNNKEENLNYLQVIFDSFE